MKYSHGFTLVELMTVVVIVAIIAAIAFPSYSQYMRKKDLATAQQEAQKVASELERHKAKNFSYSGFSPNYIYPTGSKEGTVGQSGINIPANNSKYTLQTRVAADGLSWTIIATRINAAADAQNYDLLITSSGVRCMTRATGIITTSSTNCGTSSENW